jgi:ParB/RepB/Spo0J family partition protein
MPVKPVIEEIPPSEFDLSLSRMRVMNLARMEQIERSMQLHGQLQPVVARICEQGYQIIDGLKRVYVANDLFIKTLQCLVLDVDETQARVLMLSYNRTPQTMESWEEALVLKDLVERFDVSQRELSKMTGYSRSWVSRRLALVSKIDEEVVSQIRMGVLSGSHARALMRLPRGNQAEVARAIHSWRFTSRQSDSLVDAYLEAEDETHQRQILDNPERVLFKPGSEHKLEWRDLGLSCYAEDLIKTMSYVIQAVHMLLTRLKDQRFIRLDEIEQETIYPGFKEITDGVTQLAGIIGKISTQSNKQELA